MQKQVGEERMPRFVKCRELNDLHHAKDAYLNIVVGNVYNIRYGHNARFWIEQNKGQKLTSSAKLFDRDVKTQSVTAWIAGENGTMAQVEKTMRSNAILFTQESKVEKGSLFNATLQKKNADNTSIIPLKGKTSANRKYACMSNVEKYGGYISETRVYYMLVKYVEQKITKKAINESVCYKLLGVTAKDAKKLTNDVSRIDYCTSNGLYKPQILIPRIKIRSMFEFNGTMLSLSGMTGNQIVWRLAQQNIEDESVERYLKNVIEVADKYNKALIKKETYKVGIYDGITEVQNKRLYEVFLDKLSSAKYCGSSSLTSFAQKLSKEGVKNKFENLTLEQQCKVLNEIAKSLQCNALKSDLSLLGEGSACGTILTSSTFKSLQGISIVHRSVTGIFENKIPLADFDKETTV